ncbi:MAG: type II secretion system protein, partial [Desulfobacterales bacterium]|nr:type II secretion system protein [Desulfobacterales bacterium]
MTISICKSKQLQKHGFTLLEVVIALLLMSMVTLIIGIAFRLAISAWERAKNEGEQKQVILALSGLIDNQLKHIVLSVPLLQSQKKRENLPFCGNEQAVSFYTSYTPQGSPWQGLVRMTYIFDEEKQTIYLYAQVITRLKEILEQDDPLEMHLKKDMVPISRISGVSLFELKYTNKEPIDTEDMDTWEDEWNCKENQYPYGVALHLQMDKK